jgi:hypothetical protein
VHPAGLGVQVPPPSALPHEPGGSKAQNCPGAHGTPALPPQNAPPPPWPVLVAAVAVAALDPLDPLDPPAPEADAPLFAEVSTEPLQAPITAEMPSNTALPT